MKRVGLMFAAFVALWVAGFGHAFAQDTTAQAVASCGTPPNTPVAGNYYALTQSTARKLCIDGSVSANLTALNPTGQASRSVSTSSARVALGSAGPTALVVNTGSVTAYVKFGDNTVTAATTDYPVPAGWGIAFDVGSNTNIAAITASSTTTLTITTGTGLPAITGGGSGGGGGAVTMASGAVASGAYSSGSFASGALASGSIASGAVASGAYSAGSLAAGAGVDGWDLSTGAKADSACASSASTCNVIQILKGLLAQAQSTAAIPVVGSIAFDAPETADPLTNGGLAKTTDPTAVSADGDHVYQLHDTLGKAVTIPALRLQKAVQTTTITASTSETTIITAGASGVFNDPYAFIITNSSATPATVTIKDATSGTTRFTFLAEAGKTVGFTVDAGSAVPQATAANNWTATSSASVTSLLITALYVKTKA